MLYGPFHLYHICGMSSKYMRGCIVCWGDKRDKIGWGTMVNTSYTFMKMPLGISTIYNEYRAKNNSITPFKFVQL